MAATPNRKRIAYVPLRPELSEYDVQYNAQNLCKYESMCAQNDALYTV